jgi:hypothetical protein
LRFLKIIKLLIFYNFMQKKISRRNIILSALLLLAISLSIVRVIYANSAIPNPGHDISTLGGYSATGDLLYGTNGVSGGVSGLADVATGNALLSNGVGAIPAWGDINLTNTVTGVLPSANGGTNSAYFAISGPTAVRTYAFPDANATIARTDALQTFTGVQTFSSAPVFSVGIPTTEIPNGITNGNTSRQSQVTVAGTSYYITNSNINLPATLKAGMTTNTKFVWRIAMDKTAAGTGTFLVKIYRGTNGTTADTADVSQSIGTQSAAVDSMVVDVVLQVTATGATGSYYWTIIPVNKAVTATGFGVATGPTGYFSGTVSSVAMNTAGLKFGIGFSSTTGTPTITIPLVLAQAINID